jgi:hypothetical protein
VSGYPFKTNKYRVSAPNERRWRGHTYASKAEMRYAQMLFQMQVAGELIVVIEQPKVILGLPEIVYRPDFYCQPRNEAPYFVDVKGAWTKEFHRTVKLWAEYGPLTLRVVKAKGKANFFTESVVDGGGVLVIP